MASNAENEVNTMQRIDSYELKLQQSNEEFSQVEERSRNEILSLTKLIDLFKVVPREWWRVPVRELVKVTMRELEYCLGEVVELIYLIGIL